MKTRNQILAAALALLMLLSLVACAVPDEPTPPATTETKAQPATEPGTETTEPDTSHPVSGLPAKDYGGQDFRILGRNDQCKFWGRARDIVYDNELTTTNSINEAVRDRNQYIEDLYKVNIKGTFVDNETRTAVSRAKDAGRDEYEIVEDAFAVFAQLVDDGLLENLNEFSSYLDFSQSYWNQNCRREMSIGGALYFIQGDILTTDKEGCWSISFNRDLVNNNNALENPYTLVDSKAWTLDKMYEMGMLVCNASQYAADDYFNITWGVVSSSSNTFYLWQGSGTQLIVKDAVTDLPSLAPLTEGAYDAMISAAKLNFDTSVTLFAENIKGVTDVYFDGATKIFQTGHALFKIGSLSIVEWMREYDTDFGVLPLPKATATQENYYSTTNTNYAFSLAIPTSNQNHEFTAIITQALACESSATLLDAYYDKTLVYKGLRRPEDVRMLDLIFASRLYDLSEAFTWASPLISQIGNVKSESKVKSIRSKYDSYKTNIDKSIGAFLEKHGFVTP